MVMIPDDFMRSVVFLCVEQVDDNGVTETVPRATGFLVSVPLSLNGGPTRRVTYVVTARHVLGEARRYGKLFVRVNTKAGTFVEFPTAVDDWLIHNAADVAAILFLRSALPAGVTNEDLDLTSTVVESFVGPPPHYAYDGFAPGLGKVRVEPRVGHELYFLGLFSEHYGQERNLPIARFGNISRMPSSIRLRDADNTYFDTTAYLAEFHSWGGLSGSPVFFLYPFTLDLILTDDNDVPSGREILPGWVSGFMGLITGHYEINQKAANLGDVQMALNSGIAVVTPAEAVRQLLMGQEVVEQRERLQREVDARRPTPTLDFSASEQTAEFSRADFEQALRQVSRRRAPDEPAEGTSGT